MDADSERRCDLLNTPSERPVGFGVLRQRIAATVYGDDASGA